MGREVKPFTQAQQNIVNKMQIALERKTVECENKEDIIGSLEASFNDAADQVERLSSELQDSTPRAATIAAYLSVSGKLMLRTTLTAGGVSQVQIHHLSPEAARGIAASLVLAADEFEAL